MDNITKSPAIPESVSAEEKQKFGGYTLEDIRYRRALVALQKEFARQKIVGSTKKISRHSPFSKDYTPAHGGSLGKAGAIAGKLLTGLNYMDYVILGFSIFNSGKKIFKFFRRK